MVGRLRTELTQTQLKDHNNIAINSVTSGKLISVNEVSNRMTFTYVAHVIHEDKTDSNKNGLNWQEKYVLDNFKGVVGMPIKYASDWDGEPTDHGYFMDDGDGGIVSLYAEIAGAVLDARVDTIPGTTRKGLICDAYVDTIVHSPLAKWIKLRYLEGKPIDTSIEICGKKDEFGVMRNIVYEEGINSSPKIPKEFDYIGSAILGVEPADDYATIIVVNNKGEEEKMTQKEAEDKIVELNKTITDLEKTNEDLVTVNETIETITTERDELQVKVNDIEKEKLVLEEYKEKNEESIRVNEFIDKINEDFSEEVVISFKEDIDKYKANSSEFDTSELIVNMYKEALKLKVNESKEKTDELEKIKINSLNENDMFVTNDTGETSVNSDNLDDVFEV